MNENTENINNAENTEKKELFEIKLKELEGVVKALERGNVSLDEMLEYFEKGVRLTKECTDALDSAEQKINNMIKNKETGEITEQPFEDAEK